MKEAVIQSQREALAEQGLTNRTKTQYSRFNMLEGGIPTEASAAPHVAEAVKTTAPVTQNMGEAAQPSVAEAKPGKIIDSFVPKDKEVPGEKEEEKPSEQVDSQTEQEKMLQIITLDPEYNQLFKERMQQAQAEGKTPDPRTIQMETLTEYCQGKMEETTEKIESQQENPLTPEQKMAISKEFENAFKSHYKEMTDITKKATLLAKAKANEIKLKEDQKAAEEQKTKASDNTAELKKQFDLAVNEIEASNFGQQNPDLIKHLKESPDNPDVLALLKKEKNKALLKMILEIAFAMGLSELSEGAKDVNPVSKQ